MVKRKDVAVCYGTCLSHLLKMFAQHGAVVLDVCEVFFPVLTLH